MKYLNLNECCVVLKSVHIPSYGHDVPCVTYVPRVDCQLSRPYFIIILFIFPLLSHALLIQRGMCFIRNDHTTNKVLI
jgi:hypothetical protein